MPGCEWTARVQAGQGGARSTHLSNTGESGVSEGASRRVSPIQQHAPRTCPRRGRGERGCVVPWFTHTTARTCGGDGVDVAVVLQQGREVACGGEGGREGANKVR